MGILDDLMTGAKNVVDFAGKKTDDVVELSKLKYQSSQLSNELRSLYEKLGNAVYSMMKSDYKNNELIDSLVGEIDGVKASLQAVTEKIAERKEQKLCPACSVRNDKDALYCMKCGNRLDPISAEPEEAPVQEETPSEE